MILLKYVECVCLSTPMSDGSDNIMDPCLKIPKSVSLPVIVESGDWLSEK